MKCYLYVQGNQILTHKQVVDLLMNIYDCNNIHFRKSINHVVVSSGKYFIILNNDKTVKYKFITIKVKLKHKPKNNDKTLYSTLS